MALASSAVPNSAAATDVKRNRTRPYPTMDARLRDIAISKGTRRLVPAIMLAEKGDGRSTGRAYSRQRQTLRWWRVRGPCRKDNSKRTRAEARGPLIYQ